MSNVFSSQGPLVLIVEDEALIGLELADTLLDRRYRAIGPFSSCASALAWLAESRPDAAILDIQLRDGPSTEIARELRRAGVPFLVYSGFRPRGVDAAFAGAPWLEKPILPSDLLSALAGLISNEADVALSPGLREMRGRRCVGGQRKAGASAYIARNCTTRLWA